MELTSGAYAFPQTIDRGGQTTTIHPAAIDTPKGLLLIDTGYQGLTSQLEANLTEAGFGWDDVRGVIVTHQDTDHAGSLSTVVDRTNAVVYAHGVCAPYVDGREEPIKSPDGDRYPPASVDVELVDGVRFQTTAGPMDVVYTPGHAPGHLSLHFPEQALLLAGDALTAGANRLRGPNEQYTPDMDEALASARDLADLEIEQVLCHHGGVVEAGAARIGEIAVTHHE